VQGITGSVEKIGLRSTRIRTDQKTYVTVPNKQMVDSILDNLSLRTHRKGEIILELDLGTPVKKIEELVHGLRIILSIKNIETSSVLLESISGNAFIVHADYLTAPTTQEEFNQVREGVNFALLKYLEERGIKMAGANKITRIISQEQH
jgi:MscS family membrane protein